MVIFSNSSGCGRGGRRRDAGGHGRRWRPAALGFGGSGFGGSGIFHGRRTCDGGGVWAERRAPPPIAVVEEGGWARSVAGALGPRSHGWQRGRRSRVSAAVVGDGGFADGSRWRRSRWAGRGRRYRTEEDEAREEDKDVVPVRWFTRLCLRGARRSLLGWRAGGGGGGGQSGEPSPRNVLHRQIIWNGGSKYLVMVYR
jgi:hypothetical protein